MAEPFVGEIRLFGFSYPPNGWELCNGQLLSIQNYQALFALLTNQYGGDGKNTFAVPDLRGAVPVCKANPGQQSSTAGVEVVPLTTAQMPAHSHLVLGTSVTGDVFRPQSTACMATSSDAGDFIYGQPNPGNNTVKMNPGVITNAGNGGPHLNLQPYQTINYCIATTGLWPPRP